MPKGGRAARPRSGQGPSPAAGDYKSKVLHEVQGAAPLHARRDPPYPSGDPLSGIVLVASPAPSDAGSARLADALRRSLAALNLDAAYVTWSGPDVLKEELLSLEPTILVAVGSAAASAVDDAGSALAKARFRDATEGAWFPWTRGTTGLLLPDLADALDDLDAKRRFWKAFLVLRDLSPEAKARA